MTLRSSACGDVIDRLAADEDHPALGIREAQQQPGQRGFAAAGTADQSNPCARRDLQREPLQQEGIATAVPEVDVPKFDAEVPRLKWRGRCRVGDARRVEQQLGGLRRVGQRASRLR
jgi:hypothetical protein